MDATPTVAASAALVRGICQGILFFCHFACFFFCYLALADVFPVVSSADGMSFLMPLPCFFRRIMTDH